MKLLNKKIIKSKSGITLVALVVTIVILLILAGITIATLFGENGIIKMAQKAKEETEKAQEETEKQLQNLANELSNTIGDKIESPNEWTQPDPLKPEITNGEITLKIGDYVDYDCTTSNATYTSPKEKTGHTEDQVFKANEYEYGWRVLGVDEKKQLMLLSEDLIPLTGGRDRDNRIGQYYYLKGQESYKYGIEELNKICDIYGRGRGAISARCITADDVNKITGYNPNNVGEKDKEKIKSGTKYGQGTMNEYGNMVKYTLTSEGLRYEASNESANGVDSSRTKFAYYDEMSENWKLLKNNESITLKSNYYYYYPTTLSVVDNMTQSIGVGVNDQEYKLLFTNSSTGSGAQQAGYVKNFYYWLASRYICTYSGATNFGFNFIYNGYVFGDYVYGYDKNYWKESINFHYYGIRPVVTLSSEVKLQDSNTQKDGCKLYNIIIQ